MDVWVNGAKTETNVKLCNYITKQLLSSLLCTELSIDLLFFSFTSIIIRYSLWMKET